MNSVLQQEESFEPELIITQIPVREKYEPVAKDLPKVIKPVLMNINMIKEQSRN